MEISDAIMLGIVWTFVLCLLFRQWKRERRRPSERRWTGHGLDVAGITDRVQRVRSEFALALQSRPPRDIWRRRGLLAAARRTVAQLAFFRKEVFGKKPSHYGGPEQGPNSA